MFLRSSKFRHVFGCPFKKEACYEGLKATKSAHDTNFCAVNPQFLAVVIESSGGGDFVVLPIEKTGRLEINSPKVCGHRAPITDLKWCPHDDTMIASASDDSTIKIWKIPETGLQSNLNTPVSDLNSAHYKRVSYIEWHPTVRGVLLSAGADFKCIVWNSLSATVISNISLHPDLVFSISWNVDGSLFATTCKDKKIRVICPRTGSVVAEGTGHQGNKSSRIVFLKNELLFTTGFSRSGQRQHALWDSRNLSKALRMEEVDAACGFIYPHYDPDLNIIYLAGKGDGNIRYVEIIDEPPYIYFLNQFQSSIPQRGLGMMPKRGLDMKRCEIARFFKLHSSKDVCEPISMIVPRKSDMFQPDIYPPTQSSEPSLSIDEWLSGLNKMPIYISLEGLVHGASLTKHSTRYSTSSENNHHDGDVSSFQQPVHHQQNHWQLQQQQQPDPSSVHVHHDHANDRNDVTANSNNNARKHAAIPIGDVTKKLVGRSNTFAATTNHNDPHNFHHSPITRTTGATTLARRSRPLRRRRKNSYNNDDADDSDDGRLDGHNDHKNAPLVSPSCIHTEREVGDREAFNDSQTAVSCDHDSFDNGDLLSPLQTTEHAAADVVVDEERKITFKSYNKSGKPPSKPSTPPSVTSPSSSGSNVSVVRVKSDTSDATAAEFNILDEGILRCFNKKLVNESTNNKTINVDSSRVLNNGQFNDKRVSCSSENEALRSFDFIHAEYKEHAAVPTETSYNYQHTGVVDDNNAAGSSDLQQEPIMVQNVVLLSDDANKNIDGFSQDLDVNEKCLSRQMLDCISVDAPDDGVILPSSLRASMNSRHRRFAKNGRLSSKSHQSGINPEFVGVIRVGSVREKSKNYNSVKDRDFFTKPIVETKSVSNLYDANLNLCNNINVDCDANNHTKSQDNIFAAAVHADDKEVQKGVSVNTIAQMFDQHATNSHGRNIAHDTSCSSINCDVSKNNIGSNQTILDNGCPIPNAASTFLNGTTTDSSANKVGPNLTKAFPTTSTVSPQISKQSQQSATKNAEQSQQEPTATLSVVKRSSSLYAKNVSRGGNFNNQVEASTPISPLDKSPRKFPGKSLNEFNNKTTNIGNQTIVTGSKSPPSSTSLDHNNNITNAYKRTANAERRTGNSMKPHDDVNCNGSRFEAINRRSSTEVSSRSGGHNNNFTTNNKNIKRFDGYNNPATTNVSMSHGELLQEYQKQQKEINHLKMLVEQKDLKIQKLEEELQKSKSKRYQAN